MTDTDPKRLLSEAQSLGKKWLGVTVPARDVHGFMTWLIAAEIIAASALESIEAATEDVEAVYSVWQKALSHASDNTRFSLSVLSSDFVLPTASESMAVLDLAKSALRAGAGNRSLAALRTLAAAFMLMDTDELDPELWLQAVALAKRVAGECSEDDVIILTGKGGEA